MKLRESFPDSMKLRLTGPISLLKSRWPYTVLRLHWNGRRALSTMRVFFHLNMMR